MRLLIADDSDILRSRIMQRLIEIKRIDIVGEAKDISEVIRANEALNPDILILDIRMPGGNGISALAAIKKDKKRKPIIIVFTNYPYFQYRKKCIDLGADFFFYKALEFEKLIELLEKLAQSHQR